MWHLNFPVVYVMLCAVWWQFDLGSSGASSTVWKLNRNNGKIVSGQVPLEQPAKSKTAAKTATRTPSSKDPLATMCHGEGLAAGASSGSVLLERSRNDEIFCIIASTEQHSNGFRWTRKSPRHTLQLTRSHLNLRSVLTNPPMLSGRAVKVQANVPTAPTEAQISLDCNPAVNFTYYDYLVGIDQRRSHPMVPEPEVAYSFLKSQNPNSYSSFDLKGLEGRLRHAKITKPRSAHVYNQLGNYWRIVGDSRQAIECFRRGLKLAPTNSDILLNLARLLFNLQYLDDAIHLTRRSLELQPPGRSSWLHYFTLGEIFKAYGHAQESILQFRRALAEFPGHEPIKRALRDVEYMPSTTLHLYTLIIIATLAFVVIIVLTAYNISIPGSKLNALLNLFSSLIHVNANQSLGQSDAVPRETAALATVSSSASPKELHTRNQSRPGPSNRGLRNLSTARLRFRNHRKHY